MHVTLPGHQVALHAAQGERRPRPRHRGHRAAHAGQGRSEGPRARRSSSTSTSSSCARARGSRSRSRPRRGRIVRRHLASLDENTMLKLEVVATSIPERITVDMRVPSKAPRSSPRTSCSRGRRRWSATPSCSSSTSSSRPPRAPTKRPSRGGGGAAADPPRSNDAPRNPVTLRRAFSLTMPWLVAGLGNPGPGYAQQRHNVGQMVLDELASRVGLNSARTRRMRRSPRAFCARRPATHPGQAQHLHERVGRPGLAAAATSTASIRRSLIVVHDELDIPFDTIRLKPAEAMAATTASAT